MLRTDASFGRPFTIGFHVLPKSVVRRMYGAKSPERWRSNDTYAVPRVAPDATTRPTYGVIPSDARDPHFAGADSSRSLSQATCRSLASLGMTVARGSE